MSDTAIMIRKNPSAVCIWRGLKLHDFSYDSIETDQESILDTDQLHVKVRVTNSGKRAGKETVQLYVHDCQNEIIRPEKELKGFVKLSLEPGETKTAEFVLDKRSFAYYDVEQKDFLVQSGQFEVLVGASSRDIRLKKTVIVTSTAKIHKHFHANTPSVSCMHICRPDRSQRKGLD